MKVNLRKYMLDCSDCGKKYDAMVIKEKYKLIRDNIRLLRKSKMVRKNVSESGSIFAHQFQFPKKSIDRKQKLLKGTMDNNQIELLFDFTKAIEEYYNSFYYHAYKRSSTKKEIIMTKCANAYANHFLVTCGFFTNPHKQRGNGASKKFFTL